MYARYLKRFIFLSILLILFYMFYAFALIVPNVDRNYHTYDSADDVAQSIYRYDVDSKGYISKDVKVGDYVNFGNYYTDSTILYDGKQPIVWKVIDKNDKNILLITKEIIECIPYNYTWNATTWETCTLRMWLNDFFYNVAFSDMEKEFIIETLNKNPGNGKYKVKESNDTKDKVFILSIEEVRLYFPTLESMKAVGNSYALAEGLWVSRNGNANGYSVWWLRTPGKSKSFASLVHAGGSIGEAGDGVANTGNGIRPCIWVRVK